MFVFLSVWFLYSLLFFGGVRPVETFVAGFLEMVIAIALGLAYAAARRHREFARPYLFLLGGAFMALALVFSLSRSGLISLLLTLLFITLAVRTQTSQGRLAIALGTVF